MESLPWGIAGVISGWTLAAFCFQLVMTGKLVPGTDRDYWREAFFVEQKMRQDLEVVGRQHLRVLDGITAPAPAPVPEE